MNMSEVFSKALGIKDPWFVDKISFDPEKRKLDIYLDFKRGSTFPLESGDITTYHKAYDTVEKEWRHLNFFQHECYLKARVPRVKTDDGSIHLIKPDWSGLQNGFTLLFEALVLQICKHMPVHEASKLMGASDYQLWNILDKYVDKALAEEDYSAITDVGLDETSIARGHEYITMFVDLAKRTTMFVTPGKDNSTVAAFKECLEAHGGKAENIKQVSCDMSAAFIKGVSENLPEAKITFDRFHITKLINEGVDDVRREEAKQNPLLKGMRFIFLKNDQNLSVEQRCQKEQLKLSGLNRRACKALAIRETFQQIYQTETVEEFVQSLKKWYYWVMHSRLEPMKKVGRTIKAHWDGVVQWKISQINNGILEGLNSVVQAAKRKARGYKFKHFRTMVHLLTSKLNFHPLNSYLPT